MAPLPKLEYCCCGCSLRLGVQIIGFAGLILSLLGATIGFKGVSEITIPSEVLHEDHRSDPATKAAIAGLNHSVSSIRSLVDQRLISWSSILTSSLLLYGVYKENRAVILTLVIIDAIGLTITLLIGIGCAIAGKMYWFIIVTLLILVLPFYITWVKYSYTEELRIRKGNDRNCGI